MKIATRVLNFMNNSNQEGEYQFGNTSKIINFFHTVLRNALCDPKFLPIPNFKEMNLRIKKKFFGI